VSNLDNPSTSVDDAAKPSIDLSQLAVARHTVAAASTLKTRRRWITRYVLPLGMLASFVGMFGWAARDSFLPAQSVTITPVIVTRAEVQQEGTPLFQAAGWIEPRPTPVVVSSLATGIVEQLLVAEGQLVEKGQPLATLIETDAKIALQQAEANLRLAASEVTNAEARLTAARIALEKPNELKAALADADSLLAETKLTLGNLPYAIESAKTRYQLAVDNVDRKEQAGAAIAGRLLREARAEMAAAQNVLAELEAREPTLKIQVAALERKQSALDEQLRLMSEQKRAVAEAEALLTAAQARSDQAQIAVDVSRLNLERMTIRAPIAGRVLALDCQPGKRLAGLDPISEQNSSAVVSLYDPKSLQVRVDVRLEDIPQVQIGQPVEITTAAFAKPVAGEVLWVTTRADIQKNTLQVKVAIKDPPEVITPEMLAQVTFVTPPQAVKATAGEQEPLRLLVPRQLVSGGEGGSMVWLADVEQGLARQQAVQLGRAGTDQLVEVVTGLDPTAKLIVGGRESLVAGARICVIGEDQSIGLSIVGKSQLAKAMPAAAISKQ
jgi:multidrug efflux pump subunit AcrA (membrane-fusion protein)